MGLDRLLPRLARSRGLGAIDAHRDHIGQLFGQIRDLEGHYDEATVQRIMTVNTARFPVKSAC